MTANSCMDRVYGAYVVLGELVCTSNRFFWNEG